MTKSSQVGVEIKTEGYASQEDLVRTLIIAVGVAYENAAATFNGKRRFSRDITFDDGVVRLALRPSMSIAEARKQVREMMAEANG